MRLFLGEAQWWEPLLSLAILIATCVGAILVGARIYENSLLRMGGAGEAPRGAARLTRTPGPTDARPGSDATSSRTCVGWRLREYIQVHAVE